MTRSTAGRELFYDGAALALEPLAGARRLLADPACFAGDPVTGAWAQVCASADPSAAIPFDAPEVQFARADALAWWIPLLGEDLICITTLAVDGSRYGGAVTVVRRRRALDEDPFARLFEARRLETEIFAATPPPPGPVLERYGGAPWPAAGF